MHQTERENTVIFISGLSYYLNRINKTIQGSLFFSLSLLEIDTLFIPCSMSYCTCSSSSLKKHPGEQGGLW